MKAGFFLLKINLEKMIIHQIYQKLVPKIGRKNQIIYSLWKIIYW